MNFPARSWPAPSGRNPKSGWICLTTNSFSSTKRRKMNLPREEPPEPTGPPCEDIDKKRTERGSRIPSFSFPGLVILIKTRILRQGRVVVPFTLRHGEQQVLFLIGAAKHVGVAHKVFPVSAYIVLDHQRSDHVKPHFTFVAQLKIPLRPYFLFESIHGKRPNRAKISAVRDNVHVLAGQCIGTSFGTVGRFGIHQHHIGQTVNRKVHRRLGVVIHSLLMEILVNVRRAKVYLGSVAAVRSIEGEEKLLLFGTLITG